VSLSGVTASASAKLSRTRMDLIAFDGSRFQVLSLPPAPVVPPPRPLVTQDDFEDHDPATIRRILRSSLDRRR